MGYHIRGGDDSFCEEIRKMSKILSVGDSPGVLRVCTQLVTRKWSFFLAL